MAEEIARELAVQNGGLLKTVEKRPDKPHIINHVLNDADTWYKIKLPRNLLAWTLKTRGSYEINYAFSPNPAVYMTLERGTILDQDTSPENLNEIHVRSATAGITIEMEVWFKWARQ